MSASALIRHIPCEACGSSDANALYDDGHTYCFKCQALGTADASTIVTPRTRVARDCIPPEAITITGLRARTISEATCETFGYGVAEYNGRPVQVAPYHDADGQLVAQKLRFKDKKFVVLGSLESALPFGAKRWPKSGRMIVVTEGEIDALSMSQVQGNKWPVVSIPNGAHSAPKFLAKHRDYFLGFEKVVLMFDSDEPGRAAAEASAAVIGRRAHIATLPLKDPNEMLMAGRVDELIDAMWKAQPYRPEGIVEMASLKERASVTPDVGLSYPWPFLTKIMYGIRPGQLIVTGAGVGSGKTDFYTQIAQHLVTEHGQPVGLFYLETPVEELSRRLVGKFAGKPFHVPDAGWTPDEFSTAWDGFTKGGRVFIYDNFGNNEWGPIRDKIEYLHHAEGVCHFFVDHLTALASWQDDERKALDVIMSEMGALVKRLPITLFVVTHLTTPDGKPHEEGGRIYTKHFTGSRAIMRWMTDAFGLERDQQAESLEDRTRITVRCLKERLTGRGLGSLGYLGYNRDTGLLYETSPPGEAARHGFTSTPPETPDEGVSTF